METIATFARDFKSRCDWSIVYILTKNRGIQALDQPCTWPRYLQKRHKGGGCAQRKLKFQPLNIQILEI